MSTSTGLRPAPVRGAPRLLRGWAAAAVATVLAAGSHTLGNLWVPDGLHPGHDVGPVPLLWILTLALAGPVCTALAGRHLSWWRLGAAVSASQVLFHWLYSVAPATAASGTSSAASIPAVAGQHGLHGHHAPAEVLTAAVAAGAGNGAGAGAPAVVGGHDGSAAMTAAHVVAAVVTVLLLRRGELLAARVAELALGLILRAPGARLARWVPAARPRRLTAVVRPVASRPETVLWSGLRLRGPPAGSRFTLAA